MAFDLKAFFSVTKNQNIFPSLDYEEKKEKEEEEKVARSAVFNE